MKPSKKGAINQRLAQPATLMEERFRDFLETSADWLWETDLEQRYTFYSGGGPMELGQRPEGRLRRDLLQEIGVEPKDLPETIASYMVEERPFRDLEYHFDRPDGSRVWVRLSGKPVYDREGRLVAYRGSARNVTDARIAEHQLAERHARYQSIFANAVEGIYRTAMDGRYLEVNPALARMHGFDSVEEFLQTFPYSIDMYADPRDRGRVVRLAMRRGALRGFEAYALRRDGSRFLMSETCWPVYSPNGRILGFEGLVEDITDRKRAEQALEQARNEALEASRAKSDFLAHISHELRTPLNAVIGYSDAMLAQLFGPLGNDRYEEYCQHIRDSGLHLLSIITNILDLSKVEAGQLVLRPEDCDLVEAAQSALRLVEHLAHERGVRASLRDMPEFLPFIGDPLAVRQILVNLLSNAIRFTPPPGRVWLTGRQRDGQCQISVIDEGIGMTQDEISQALLPFRQVDNPMTRSAAGTGLGLSLVKGLAEAHGGSLEIQSRPGQGTRVTITLGALESIKTIASSPARPPAATDTPAESDNEQSSA
ncbi:sensor histidine kinase [Aquibaculum arenosum]|uniref:histidine kinase n=1 Tax=Aquibaculum arenosum TaxID=3032591 RepID=A0ABT5YNI4_9PROT|nr:PAS domain-containing sensor histidine kinase [Fodinicurvata sp. CAU 1616]MDF2096514.1 PAS domain-containing sensor histidine kinase [Fodinicurvata sp. CAU 1616]